MTIPDELQITDTDKAGSVSAITRHYLAVRWFELAPETRRIYARAATTLISSYGDRSAAALSPDDIGNMTLPVGVKSQVMNLASAAINYARKRGKITGGVPWSRCAVKIVGEWEPWTPQDVDKAISGPEFGVMRDIVLFAAGTGMRRGDILSLNHLNFYKQNDRVHLAYTQSKTGAVIDMPLTASTANLDLVKRALSSKPLFGKVTKHSFYRVYMRYCRKIGVSKPFHGLRKFCATRLAEAGCSMPEIMSVTGHQSTTTTMKYIKSANKSKLTTNAIERLEKL
jgi:integrase